MEIDSGVVASDDSLAICADDGVGDLAGFCLDGELGEDVFVELREELEPDIATDAWGDLALGLVLYFEIVLQ